jgi:hypothetical protein
MITSDFDSPWKEAIEVLFPAFMQFFFPAIHREIDWSRGYLFLDKELEKVVRDATLGRRYADKLVRVFLLGGQEAWLLIHIEVQGYRDADFPERMYVYHYRIFDRYGVEVVSLAVLSDDDPAYRPAEYHRERWGCELIFRFPIAKVLDYAEQWALLEASANPFALVVMAHLKARETRTRPDEQRKAWKLNLIKHLYRHSYGRQEVLELFRFIDWLLVLPPAVEQALQVELSQLEEEQRMPYLSNIERIGLQKGLERGSLEEARAMLLEAVDARFGGVPVDVAQAVNTMQVPQNLRLLLRQAIILPDLAAFREALRTAEPSANQ